MKTELEINIKNTIIGWTSISLILMLLFELIIQSWKVEDLIYVPIAAIFIAIILVFYWIILIYLWSAFLTVGNDIGTKIVKIIIHKKQTQI